MKSCAHMEPIPSRRTPCIPGRVGSLAGLFGRIEMVKDIATGLGPKPEDPSHLTPIGNRIVFTAKDPQHGMEIWKSNGTPAGRCAAFSVRVDQRGGCHLGGRCRLRYCRGVSPVVRRNWRVKALWSQ